MTSLLRDPRPVLDRLRADHGAIVGLGAGPARMAVVGDPVALRELFGEPVGSYRWGHRFNARWPRCRRPWAWW